VGNRCVSWVAGGDHTSGPVPCGSLVASRRVVLVASFALVVLVASVVVVVDFR
jgi:hypothetical protein